MIAPRHLPLILLAAVLAAPAAAQTTTTPSATVQRPTDPLVARAAAFLDADHDRWTREVIAITEIPAPPFKEQVRAEAYARMLRDSGLAEVTIDAEGNVLALRKGMRPGPAVVVSAHLDTVFPEGTPIKVRREGDRLHAPGVGDDSTGLATMLSIVRAMNAAGLRTERDILFVGTVGEEGLGDLRGVRHLFNKGEWKGRIGAFFSIDGSGDRLVNGAVGSKRYRVTFKGPGGHSYGAFGLVNPAAALAGAVSEFYRTVVPADPRTTYNVGVLSGGTSVNTIPAEVAMEVDMRSPAPAELAKLETRLRTVVAGAVAAENAARSTRSGTVSAELTQVGDRPAGSVPATAPLVRDTLAAARSQGLEWRLQASSTDSNIPISLGIPAVTVPYAVESGRAHSPDEWVNVSKPSNVRLKTAILLSVLAAARAPTGSQAAR